MEKHKSVDKLTAKLPPLNNRSKTNNYSVTELKPKNKYYDRTSSKL